jgi:hypothetical protein
MTFSRAICTICYGTSQQHVFSGVKAQETRASSVPNLPEMAAGREAGG